MFRSFELEEFDGNLCVITGFFSDTQLSLSLVEKYNLCVLLGGITDDESKLINSIKVLSTLSKKIIYIKSFNDLIFEDQNKFEPTKFGCVNWLSKQSISASIAFKSFTRYIFTNGAVLPEIKVWEKQKNSASLTKQQDSWLNDYNGRFGYSISASNTSKDILFLQNGCIIGNDDKPILLNVDERGVERVEETV